MHNICQFGRHTNICLTNFFAGDKQKCFWKVWNKLPSKNVLVRQCLLWWPNAKACSTSKIQNVCRFARALEEDIDQLVSDSDAEFVADEEQPKCLPPPPPLQSSGNNLLTPEPNIHILPEAKSGKKVQFDLILACCLQWEVRKYVSSEEGHFISQTL